MQKDMAIYLLAMQHRPFRRINPSNDFACTPYKTRQPVSLKPASPSSTQYWSSLHPAVGLIYFLRVMIMNFLSLIPIFSTLIDRLFPDKEKAEQAKLDMQKTINEANAEQIRAQSAVIVAETQSQSYSARNWRPHLMYMLMITVAYSIIITPLLKALGLDIPTYTIPDQAWTLLTVGLGGYIGKDALANYTSAKFDAKKFYDTYRKEVGSLDQATVNKLDKALKDASS